MYIYIHIPFCSNICSYCDFPKVLYYKKFINRYLDVLKKEILSRYNGGVVKSLYVGGGTPTSLDLLELDKLFEIVSIFNRADDMEFTIEANVLDLDVSKIELMASYGVNRVSLGVQSFDKDILKELNRYHTKDDVFRVVNDLKENNINNINIDLIYGVNNNIDVIKKDIDYFLELDIPHISCYSLIIEDNTIFGINKRDYIDSNIDYEIYKYIEDKLISNNFIHYEVSNYCREGYQSLHNLNYWDNGFYYGFGMGAVSYVDGYRITNTKNFSKYLKEDFVYTSIYEDDDLRISNAIILGLRKTSGINIMDFNSRYGVDILSLYNIRELINDNKLIINNNYICINPDYFYVSNDILINFL